MPPVTRILSHVQESSTSQSNQLSQTHRDVRGNGSIAMTESSLSPDQSLPESSTAQRFQCSQCPRAFTRRENLSRHAKTHSAPWAHRCTTCGKGFARSDLLSRHEAGHQRWSKQESGHQSSVASNKRRKIAFVDEVANSSASPSNSNDHLSSELINSAWESGQQNTPINSSSSSIPMYRNTSSLPTRSSESFTPHGISGNLQQTAIHTDIDFVVPTAHSQHPSQPPFTQLDLLPGVEQARNYSIDLASHELQLESFDFSEFLLPGDGNDVDDFSGWFSDQFYSAMQETGNEHAEMTGFEVLDFPFANLPENYQTPSSIGLGSRSRQPSLVSQEANGFRKGGRTVQSHDRPSESNLGPISRMSSPPNEASEEDNWAFAWDPKSRAILHADPISIPLDHSLWRQHNPRFDISESTFRILQKFLSQRTESLLHPSSLTLPSLPEVNILIGLYFEHFSPRMPVLHHATVDTNKDLPPPLLGAIIVIGAIYSRLKGTRRFAIVLLDIVRWHLQIAIENDNSLMRDLYIMFAEALICYTGLWCGNKRAFELAEVVRATAVKHIRSARFLRGNQSSTEKDKSEGVKQDNNLSTQWLGWIQKESQKRLFWVIYALDVQFTSLLYQPATFVMGEVCDLCCPCDEEFWAASSARHWKSVLGPATEPPSRSFSAAAAPFLWTHWNSGEAAASRSNTSQNLRPVHLPVLGLNDWSAFLVLITLHSQIFQFVQERIFINSCFGIDGKVDDEEHYVEGQHNDGLVAPETPEPVRWQKARRDQFKDSLLSWQDSYLPNSSKHDPHATSIHFRHSSSMSYILGLILLDAPNSDIHDALGKNGRAGIVSAMANMTLWIDNMPQIAEDTVYTAIKMIASLTTGRGNPPASEQLIVTTFLCHVIVWIFASIASKSQIQSLLARLPGNEVSWKSPQMAALRKGLEGDGDGQAGSSGVVPNLSKSDRLRGIFRSAAECLMQFGTWGAALNMALLLQRRTEV